MGGSLENRRIWIRRMAILVGLVAVAALLAGIAAARPNSTPPPVISAQPPTTVREFTRALDARLRAYANFNKTIAGIAARKRKRGSKVVDMPIVLGGAADGKFLYWPRLTLHMPRGGDADSASSFRTAIIRTDLSTGKDTKLLEKPNTLAFNVYAANGKAFVQTMRSMRIGGREVVKLTLYSATAVDPTLKAEAITKIASDDEEASCTSFSTLSGISSSGEPIMADYTQSCDPGQPATLVSKYSLRAVDGSNPVLAPAPPSSMFLPDSVRLAAGKLVATNPFTPATAATDIASGTTANLWSPGARAFDVADDGTIALLGAPPAGSELDSAGDFEGFLDPDAKPAQPKVPLVLFPGGDANGPKLLNASRAKVESLKFCGDHLFAVVGSTTLREAFANLDPVLQTLYFMLPSLAVQKHQIDVYDRQGNFLRTATKLSQVGIGALGCNGQNLVIGVVHGDKMRGAEVTP